MLEILKQHNLYNDMRIEVYVNSLYKNIHCEHEM